MTTGASSSVKDWSSPFTLVVGDTYREHSISWNGVDRPRVDRRRGELVTITRGGKTFRYRLRRPGSTPNPRRGVEDVPHAFSKSIISKRDEVVQYYDTAANLIKGKGNGTMTGTYPDGSVWTVPAWNANDDIKLVGKLREKLFGSDFNASVFLGESSQTLGLITDSALRVAKSLRFLKKGAIGDAARALTQGTPRNALTNAKLPDWRRRQPALRGSDQAYKDMSSNWLELQYGWLPLLSDAESAAQSLAHALNVPFVQRYRVRSRKERSQKTAFAVHPASGGTWNYHKRTYEQKQILLFTSEKPGLAAQLGLLNPENVAWELMPWSFVIDWFIPIGSYLDARALTSCVNGTYVTSTLTKGELMWDSGKWAGASWHKYVTFNRVVSTSPTLPLPVFKGLAKAASWRHCANAIALLALQR